MFVKNCAVIEYVVTKRNVTAPRHLGSMLAITVGVCKTAIMGLEIARCVVSDYGRACGPYIGTEAKGRVIRVVRTLNEGGRRGCRSKGHGGCTQTATRVYTRKKRTTDGTFLRFTIEKIV